MGRAIVRDPKVFLFDEPLSNLDAKLRVQMRTEIKKLHQTVKTTTVYVTHDQVEAMTLADRVVVMNDGMIEQVGTPQRALPPARRPASSPASSARPAMNFIPAKLESQRQRAETCACPTTSVVPVPAEPHRPLPAACRQGRAVRPAAGAHHRDARPIATGSAGRNSRSRSTWSSRWAWRPWCSSRSTAPKSAAGSNPTAAKASGETMQLARQSRPHAPDRSVDQSGAVATSWSEGAAQRRTRSRCRDTWIRVPGLRRHRMTT